MNEEVISVEVQKPEYTLTESIFAWLCILIGYLFCLSFPSGDYPLGMFLVFLIAIPVTAVTLIKKGAKLGLSSVASAVISLGFAFSPIVTSDSDMNGISVYMAIFAYCYFIYSAGGNRLEKGFSDLVPIDVFIAVVRYPLYSFGRIFYAAFSGKSKCMTLLAKVLLGLILGIIPAVTVSLLLAYDEGFSNIMASIFNAFEDLEPLSHLGSLILGILLAILIFSMYYTSTENKDRAVSVEACREKAHKLRRLTWLTAGAALIPLLAVYVIFFISQFDYYISAFSGTLPEGITYANYAREGFFELCKVSGINLALLAALALFVKKSKSFEKLLLKAASLVISFITLVLIATAMSKMVLYVDTYGLTVKRLLASWAMVLFGVLFLLIIIKQFVPKMKIIASCVCAVVFMVAVLAFSNYEGIIADYNVDKYISGEFESVDVKLLFKMGEPAVPAMVRLAEKHESVRDELLINSNLSMEKIDETYNDITQELESLQRIYERNDGIFMFSVPRIRAITAIDEFFE